LGIRFFAAVWRTTRTIIITSTKTSITKFSCTRKEKQSSSLIIKEKYKKITESEANSLNKAELLELLKERGFILSTLRQKNVETLKKHLLDYDDVVGYDEVLVHDEAGDHQEASE
jgi:hypothetical protein